MPNFIDAHKIIDHLYQGGAPPQGDALKKAGVDVLVLCAQEIQDKDLYTGIEVICAPGDDDERPHRLQRYIEGWKQAAHTAAQFVRLGRNVLVTCYAGQNRSGLVVALILKELSDWNGEKIVRHVQSRRPMALNNTTFTKYVIESFP